MNGTEARTKPGVSVDPLRDKFIAAGMPDAVLLDGSQSCSILMVGNKSHRAV